MTQELFKFCSFVISDKLPEQNEKLRAYITDKLNFKIAKYNPLTIEKENVTHQNLQALIETLKAKYEPEENDYVFVPDSERHCNQIQTSTDSRTDLDVVGTKILIPEIKPCRQNEYTSAGEENRDISQNTAEQLPYVDDEIENISSSLGGLSISPESNTSRNKVEKSKSITGRPKKSSFESHELSSAETTGVDAALSGRQTTNSASETSNNEIIAAEERMHQNATDAEERKCTASINVSVNCPPVLIPSEARKDVTAVTNKTEIVLSHGAVSSSRLIGGNGESTKSLPSQNLVDSHAEIESNVTQSKPEEVSTSDYHKGTDDSITSSQMLNTTSKVDRREDNNSFVGEKVETDQDFSENVEENINKEDIANPHHVIERNRHSISESDVKKLNEVECSRGQDTANPHHVIERNRHSISESEDKKLNDVECSRGQDDESSENETKNRSLCVSEDKAPLSSNEQFSMKRQLGKKTEAVEETKHHQHHEHSEDTKDEGNESAHLNEEQRQMMKDRNKSYERQEMLKNDQKQTVESTTDQTMKNMTGDRDATFEVPQGSNDDSITEYTLNWSEYWNFECAEWHLNTESCKSYFKNATTKDAQVTFRINKSDPQARAFIKQVKQLKFEKIVFNIRDKEQAMKLLKHVEGDTGTTVTIFNNLILIVGMKEEVSRAKKLITEKLHYLDNTESESSTFKHNLDKGYMGGSNQTFMDEGNNARGFEYGMISTMNYGPDSAHSRAVNVPAMTQFRNNDTLSSAQRSSQQSSYHNQLHFITESSKLVVQIHKADITKFKAEVIVNAANRRLQHNGGVAKAISKAAGRDLNKECEDFINSGNILDVTDMFKSKGGNLPAKFVFHAVGPKWEAYQDKQMCIDDLRHTVLRCLVEAGRQGARSIALPSISAAIFKVPKEICARCYMEAVKHFDIFSSREGGSLREINFIDVDDTMVNHIIECFTKYWDKANDPEKLKNDLDFAKFHLLPKTFKTQVPSKENSNSAIAKSLLLVAGARDTSSAYATGKSSSVTGARETASAYATGNWFQFRNFTLELRSGHAFDTRAGITITIGKPFDKLSGLSNFQIEQNLKKVDKMPYSKKGYRFSEVIKPGTKWSRLLLAVYPEPDTVEAIPESFGNLELAIQKCDKSEIHGRLMNGLIITSHILYGEIKSKHPGGRKVYDSKKIGKFADILYQYMGKLSGTTQANISMTVVGDEDSLPLIERVMESRVGPARVSGAHPKQSGEQHRQQRQGGSSDYYPDSQRDERSKFTDEGRSGEGARDSDYYYDSQRDERSKSKDEGRSVEGARGSSYDQTDQSYHNKTDSSTSVDPQKSCQICFDDRKTVHFSRCCRKLFCLECEMKLSVCPFCRCFWRIINGYQPDGFMKVDQIRESADGYEGCPAWRIEYFFPSGIQKDHHPNPGKHYSSCKRVAYLPANDEGFKILTLLRLSFIRRLTFTIGASLTTNKEGAITWNDIHHKTSLHSGTYGYPDPTYMQRVLAELVNRGVRFDTTTDEENRDLHDFHYQLQRYKCFYNY